MSKEQRDASPKSDAQADAESVRRREQSLDQALRETFPASDPPAAIAPHSSEE